MEHLTLATSPILAMLGQIAAIVICLFVLVFVLLTVAFSVVMSFAMSWVREKADLIKMLRPTVEGINKASESVSQGLAPVASENAIIRGVASLPASARAIDKKVQRSTDRTINAVIELRARTVQVQTVVKAFLLPGLIKRKTSIPTADEVLDGKGPGSWQVIGEQSPQRTGEAAADASSIGSVS